MAENRKSALERARELARRPVAPREEAPPEPHRAPQREPERPHEERLAAPPPTSEQPAPRQRTDGRGRRIVEVPEDVARQVGHRAMEAENNLRKAVQLQAQMDDLAGRLKATGETLTRAEGVFATKQRELEEKLTAAEAGSSRAKILEKELADLREKYAKEHAGEIGKRDTMIQQLEQAAKDRAAELTEARAQLEIARRETGSLRENQSEAARQVEQLSHQVDQLLDRERAYAETKREFNLLDAARGQLLQDAAAANEKLIQENRRLKETADKIPGLANELSDMKALVERLQTAINATGPKEAELLAAIETMKRQVQEKAGTNVEDAKERAETLKALLDVAAWMRRLAGTHVRDALDPKLAAEEKRDIDPLQAKVAGQYIEEAAKLLEDNIGVDSFNPKPALEHLERNLRPKPSAQNRSTDADKSS